MDPIADMLTSLVNAQRVGKKRVAVPYSHFKKNLLTTLQEQGYISSVRVQESPKSKLVVSLAYDDFGNPKIRGVKRMSSPGGRMYARHAKMPYSYEGYGTIIVSTSRGLMDEKKARKDKVGGELVCAIW